MTFMSSDLIISKDLLVDLVEYQGEGHFKFTFLKNNNS